jgi:hypothetical protein
MSKSNPELKSEYNSIARLRERVLLGLPQHANSQFIVEMLVDGMLNVRLREDPSAFCVVDDDPRGMTEAALLLHYAPSPRDAARTAVRWGLREGGKDGLQIHQRVVELLQEENEGSLLPVLQRIQIARAYDAVLKVTWQAQDGAEIVRWFDARELTKLSDDALVDMFCTGNLAEGERLPDEPEYSRWQYLKAFFTGNLK